MTLHLGKHPASTDIRDLTIADYLDLAAPIHVPWNLGHEDKMPQPRLMLGNGSDDSVAPGFGGAGCCVLACIANAIRLAVGIAGAPVPPITGKEVIAAYSEVTGYVIGDASTDNGTDMRTALNWWRTTGFADSAGVRHKLGAFVAIPPGGHLAWFRALAQLDIGVGLGIQFPSSAMEQFNAGQVWQPVPGATLDGGHAIFLDARRQWPKVETWARDQDASESFLEAQVDEAWALFMPEMLVAGKSPEGLNVTQLSADLQALAA